MRPKLIALALAVTAGLAIVSGPARAETADLREKIGQMILIGFEGAHTEDARFKHVLEQVRDGRIGGVLYLGRNIASGRDVRSMNAALNKAADGRQPLLIAVDQEGGRIQRLTPRVGFPSILAASRVARMDPNAALLAYRLLGQRLGEWGFNLNLGPVVDLNVNPANPIIGRLGRSYSSDPEAVRLYATAFIKAHREHGVLTAIKHFPGHGSSTADSHDGLVDVSGTWTEAELKPFSEIILDGNADMVMTAHVRNRHLQEPGDSDPVSLSKQAISDVLRGKLGFAGVVISDDMQMAGVTHAHDLRKSVLRAVMAGTDILIFANDKNPDPDIADKVIAILAGTAAERPDVAARIEESYKRIVELKLKLRIRAPGRSQSLTTRSIATTEPAEAVAPLTTNAIAPLAHRRRLTVVTPQVMSAMARDERLSVQTDVAPAAPATAPTGL